LSWLFLLTSLCQDKEASGDSGQSPGRVLTMYVQYKNADDSCFEKFVFSIATKSDKKKASFFASRLQYEVGLPGR
jgi:hypothetical protein